MNDADDRQQDVQQVSYRFASHLVSHERQILPNISKPSAIVGDFLSFGRKFIVFFTRDSKTKEGVLDVFIYDLMFEMSKETDRIERILIIKIFAQILEIDLESVVLV